MIMTANSSHGGKEGEGEVQDAMTPEYNISRNEAKKNLHLVGEIT